MFYTGNGSIVNAAPEVTSLTTHRHDAYLIVANITILCSCGYVCVYMYVCVFCEVVYCNVHRM